MKYKETTLKLISKFLPLKPPSFYTLNDVFSYYVEFKDTVEANKQYDELCTLLTSRNQKVWADFLINGSEKSYQSKFHQWYVETSKIISKFFEDIVKHVQVNAMYQEHLKSGFIKKSSESVVSHLYYGSLPLINLQRFVRGYIARRFYKKTREAIRIQKQFRGYIARKNFQQGFDTVRSASRARGAKIKNKIANNDRPDGGARYSP